MTSTSQDDRRRAVIREMLLTLDDVVLGGTGDNPRGRGGGYTLQFGPLCTPPYRELLRLLERMKVEQPRERRHVMERYVYAERRPLDVPFKRQKRQGKIGYTFSLPAHTELVSGTPHIRDEKTARVVVYRWSSWTRPDLVGAGVRWLAEEFRGMPALPREMFQASSDPSATVTSSLR